MLILRGRRCACVISIFEPARNGEIFTLKVDSTLHT
jgi:hypothetical protein